MTWKAISLLLSAAILSSCAASQEFAAAPRQADGLFDAVRINGAVRINHEATNPGDHEASQPARVSIGTKEKVEGQAAVRFEIQPGVTRVIRLAEGVYEYKISSAQKAPQTGSFEIRAPHQLIFELTLNLRLPVRQAYYWDSSDGFFATTLRHPTVPVIVLSDSKKTVRFSARAPQDYRAPSPLPPCSPQQPDQKQETNLTGLLGGLFGGAGGTSSDSSNSRSAEGPCYDPKVSPKWLEWIDRFSIQDVKKEISPRKELDVAPGFDFVLPVPANVNLPAGAWLLTTDKKKAALEIKVGTRIVVVDWGKSPPEVLSIPETE